MTANTKKAALLVALPIAVGSIVVISLLISRGANPLITPESTHIPDTDATRVLESATDKPSNTPDPRKPSPPGPPKTGPVVTVPQPVPVERAQPSSGALLFGMGPQADGAQAQRLTAETPVKILSNWFNSPDDLGFMRGWQDDRIPYAYAKGYSMHLIVRTDNPEGSFMTKYGPACGRSYPFSDRFASDMKELATIYRGSGILYVSMFTELQTFPCQDNSWKGNENYYRALMDQFRLARDIFKTHAPNSQISLTWGGWQSRWDYPANGGGRSLIPYFADVMNLSDFQSFQAMDSRDNVKDISDMSALLHKFGNGRVMIAHYKPDNGSQVTWNQDMQRIFTPSNVQSLKNNGVFAFNFMDGVNINANEASYQQAKNVVLTYGR